MKKKIKNRLKPQTDKYGNVSIRTKEEFAEYFKLPPSFVAEWNFRNQLVEKFFEIFQKQKITHASLAKKVGTSRPRITTLLNNRCIGASTELLVRMIGALGYQIELVKFRKIAS